ncbi:Desiccation protectant protein Lea14-like protein [Bienertia sinuspersici]
MASDGNPRLLGIFSRGKEEGKEDEGFFDKAKDIISDVGEKIENVIGFGKPIAHVTGIHIPHINHQKVEFVVDVLVRNPIAVPIPLMDINYSLESDERKLVSGSIPDTETIRGHSSETVKIPVTLIFDDIRETFHEIRTGSIIPYTIKVDLIIDVPVFGKNTIPLQKSGEIPIPHKPNIDLEKIKFQKFTWEETIATLYLKIEHKNDFDLGLKGMQYVVWLGEVNIGGAQLENSGKLPKNDTIFIDHPITFRPKDFGSALWDMIKGRGTTYSIKGNINVDTPFGEMKLPINREGSTTLLQ